MPPILLAFLACFALSASCIVVASLALIVLFLLFVGFSWVVGCVVGSFSLRMIATKERERRRWCSLSLFVGCGLVMQNRVFRPRKTRNCYPLFLRLYIHQSMSIRNRFATA